MIFLRVISGKYKGKNILGFDIDGTRPTMDRVKESLFAMIQDKIKDSVVLDLFSGSGSLGIEAISNGASSVYFVDNNIKAIETIKKNTRDMNEEIHIIKSDYKDAIKLLKNTKFDLILLDPPYKSNLINDCIEKIHEYNLINDSGIIVCEFEEELIDTSYYNLIKSKKYGSKTIRIYRND